MTETEFASYLVGSLFLCYTIGFQWGKYVRILNDLGR
jgi:hypothetical protein